MHIKDYREFSLFSHICTSRKINIFIMRVSGAKKKNNLNANFIFSSFFGQISDAEQVIDGVFHPLRLLGATSRCLDYRIVNKSSHDS